MNLTSFYETRDLFLEYTQYSAPLSFDEWSKLPEDENNKDYSQSSECKKTAVLYLQFFPEIIAAWQMANSYDFIPAEDGVTIVLQYLRKNAPKIEQDSKRFTASYIYRVAYNCMYCICHDRICDKERWANETPNIVGYGDDQVDLFDLVSTDGQDPVLDKLERETIEALFWNEIKEAGPKAEKLAYYLLNQDNEYKKAIRPSSKKYIDELSAINLIDEEIEPLMEQLRSRLAKFAPYFNVLTA